MDDVVKKKRKTLDEYLGINGLLIVAILASFIGDFIGAIGCVAGLSAIYYLIKRRKELEKKKKVVGWVLVVVWLFAFGINNSIRGIK